MFTQPSAQEQYQARLEQVITFLAAHLAEPLSLETLAGVAGFSPYHFHRIFSGLLGETPGDALNRLRLERAANLLLKSPQSITAIALVCGFSSSATFARSFRQRFGLTASEYRSQGGATLQTNSDPLSAPIPLPDLGLVQVKPLPAIPVIYVANLEGYSIEKICAAWNRLMKWGGTRGLLGPQTRAIGVTFDDPLITAANRCRYYACLTVPGKVETGQRVSYMEIGAGLHALAHVTVTAQEISLVYHAMYGQWLPGSGLQPADRPTYEIYLQTPDQHPEGKYELEVCIPVEPL
jgi:AraC family transcriptional regulator